MRYPLPPKTAHILEMFIDGPKTLSQIQAALKVSKPMALKTLSELEKDGLLSSYLIKTKSGREKKFCLESFSMVVSFDLNRRTMLSFVSDGPLSLQYPLLGQVKQVDFRDAIGKYLEVIASNLKKKDYAIILFGSAARGEGTRKSDLDIVFISREWHDNDKNKVRELLAGIVHLAEIMAKPLFWEYKMLGSNNTMPRAVRNEGLVLYSQGDVGVVWQMLERYKSISH